MLKGGLNKFVDGSMKRGDEEGEKKLKEIKH